MLKKILITFVIGILVTFSSNSFAHSDTVITITSGQDLYNRVNGIDTLDDALIIIPPGSYNIPATLNISSGIRIQGENATTTRLNFTGGTHGIEIHHGDVIISNIAITRSETSDYTDDGCAILSFEGGCEFNKLQIYNYMQGIFLRDHNWAIKIFNCSIFGCDNGIVTRNGEANDITIRDCEIRNNWGYGIWLESASSYISPSGTDTGSTINLSEKKGAASFRIRDNNLHDNGRSGIKIEVASNVIIDGNYMEGNDWRLQTEGNEASTNDVEIDIGGIQHTNGQTFWTRNIKITNNWFEMGYPREFTKNGVVCNGSKNTNLGSNLSKRPFNVTQTDKGYYSFIIASGNTVLSYVGGSHLEFDGYR